VPLDTEVAAFQPWNAGIALKAYKENGNLQKHLFQEGFEFPVPLNTHIDFFAHPGGGKRYVVSHDGRWFQLFPVKFWRKGDPDWDKAPTLYGYEIDPATNPMATNKVRIKAGGIDPVPYYDGMGATSAGDIENLYEITIESELGGPVIQHPGPYLVRTAAPIDDERLASSPEQSKDRDHRVAVSPSRD
jgi:hypothetical protein